METKVIELQGKETKNQVKIMGISLQAFALISIVVLGASFMEALPKGMVGAFPIMIVLGAIFNELGNRLPIVKDYLGGGPIVVIFGSAALVAYKVIPESSIIIMDNFMKGESFLDFYIAALITGSILGMNRKLLIKASLRYLPIIIGGVFSSFVLAGIAGSILGYGAKEAILFIALPIMGGGMGAGAVPLAQIFGGSLSIDSAEILSKMVPAVALGNALAIIMAGLLDRIGKGNKKLSGNGKLMKGQDEMREEKEVEASLDYTLMGSGLLIATSFFILGRILALFIPLHSYALMILSVAAVKAFGLFPQKYEQASFQWFRFVMVNLTPALLIGIGVAYTDLNQVISAFSLTYLIIIAMTIIGASVGAGFVGNILGFYPVEASVTGGLCMANMGGTGDVAVLSASNRMDLMPFAQISSRIGGAFMLILATAILKILA